MFLPPAFREDRLEVQHALMRAHPFALLVTAGPAGLLANPLPFALYVEEGEEQGRRGVLRAHVSRANEVWRELAAVGECLVVFQGPHHYITPSWYASKAQTHKVVPTWNYATVHAWGAPRVVHDAGWLLALLHDLTQTQESGRAAPWRIADAPAAYIDTMLKGIVGIEIPIARCEGKWKVSQNRLEADRQGVVAGLAGEGEDGAAMAELVMRAMPANRIA
ncbi:MAG: FMN-binding negative transcriptional regulator [Janthinobacterium lividum]